MILLAASIATFLAGFLVGAIWTHAWHVLPAMREADLYAADNQRLRDAFTRATGTDL